MAERSADIIDQATDALAGISDLLCSIERGNLHQVDPGNLYSLVEVVRVRLVQAGIARGEEGRTG